MIHCVLHAFRTSWLGLFSSCYIDLSYWAKVSHFPIPEVADLCSCLIFLLWALLFCKRSLPSPPGPDLFVSHTSDPPPHTPTLLPCCLWPSEIKHFREREIVLFEIWVEVVTWPRMRPWERIVVIASPACFLLLWFPLISLCMWIGLATVICGFLEKGLCSALFPSNWWSACFSGGSLILSLNEFYYFGRSGWRTWLQEWGYFN